MFTIWVCVSVPARTWPKKKVNDVRPAGNDDAHHLIFLLRVTALFVEGCVKHMSATLSPQHRRRLTYIGITAVQDGLVATAVLANVREGLDDA